MGVAQVIYIGYTEPFAMRWMNWLELTNEFLIITGTYFLIIYSNGFLHKLEPRLLDRKVKDWEAQEVCGWFHVGHLGIITGLNMSVMLAVQIGSILRTAKLYFLKRKYDRQMKALQERKQALYSLN